MRRVAAILILALGTVPGSAAPRPATGGMTCRSAAALVHARGAVVLSTGPQSYDRYVSTRGFCSIGTYARPAFVATADTAQCYIGFYCSSAPPLFGPD